MNTLIRRSPFGEFDNVSQSMERVFDNLWNSALANAAHPVPMDVFEKADGLYVRATLPGIKPEDIEVTAENNVLTIRGETKAEWETNESKVYRRENRYGQFTRSLRLPEGYMPEEAIATFEHGVITVKVPRAEVVQPKTRKIELRAAEGSKQALPLETETPKKPHTTKAT